MSFSECLATVKLAVFEATTPSLLVLEAPLSTCHDKAGNPCGRKGRQQGVAEPLEFERGREFGRGPRYWYMGAGAVTAMAAMRFLTELADAVHRISCPPVFVAEALLSFKSRQDSARAKPHAEDAAFIAQGWHTAEPIGPIDCSPVIDVLDGVPQVRQFVLQSVE